MKIEDCKIGTKVRWYGDGEFTIRSIANEKNRVKITGKDAPDHLVSIDDLHVIDEEQDKLCAAKTQALIDKAKNAFEEAFKAYKDASDVSYENGMGLYEMESSGLISTEELEDVVEQGGWSMSSLICSVA